MEFFKITNIHMFIAIVLSAINGVLMCLCASRLLHVIQLAGYKINGFRAWLKETKGKYIGRLAILCFLSLACVLTTNALLDGYGEFYSYVGLIFYFYFCIVFITHLYKTPQKTPLKQTKRMTRLTILVFFLMASLTLGLIAVFSEYVPWVKFGVVAITPIFLAIIVPIAHFIAYPFEMLFRQLYIQKAIKKLKKYPNLIKIGITGSFGKTTTKHILNVMLSKKYKVCMSPHSFNTPMGLTKVVNAYLKPEHEVLICEMGARQLGDINYLCKLIKPMHAIITSVGNQHLATFGSQENIFKAKNELVENITNGIICFNENNDGAMKLYDGTDKTKIKCGVEKEDAYANISNVKVDINGATFTLTINKKSIDCRTKLIGKSNLEDIAISAGLAHKLGVSLSAIKSAIMSLDSIPHRLEVINENGIIIIDNSYNSSVESSKNALQTLAMFEGNKIVITPGIVELGDEEKNANIVLGEEIAKVANKVIIVNESNREALKIGLNKGNFNDEIFVDNLEEAKVKLSTFVQQGDIILLENDLPDNYL